jgi:predicted transposase/invertase (TIGR01784 family)
MNETKNDAAVPVPFEEATGPIDVTLKNDMMFHLVMARSKKALKGLVCALKGLNPDDVKDVELMNPIDYSMYATKEIILDVKVSLNNNEVIDIELQMYKDRPWEERSLLYLCRSFDSIGEGEDYAKLMPTTFIAIMNDPLFPKYPEFYSKYMLLNIKNFQPYSSKIKLNVLYLNMTEKAEQEDIDNKLVYWAELFKTTTWDDLKKLCTRNEAFMEVAQVMYKSNIQSQEKTYLEAHEKYLLDKRSMENRLLDQEKALKEKDEEITSMSEEKAKLITLLKQQGMSDAEITAYLKK